MITNQGLFSYPGVQQWDSFKITDLGGIAPAIGVVKMFPQYGVPALNGDIVLTYNDQHRGLQRIVFKSCQIDAASYERNSGGQIVSVRIFDERWAWQYRQVTGRYNYKLPNNFVDPDHEKTPRQLATLCFQALKVQNFDVSALPNDARPDIDWDHENAAQALAKLCDDLGCRIVPQRSTGAWIVVVAGEGRDLPGSDKYPVKETGSGIDPKEVPDYLRIITSPISYQVALAMEPVAKDMDQSWKLLQSVSYAPDPSDYAGGFGDDYLQFADVSYVRVTQPDGSKISPQEMALQTVFRCWRISAPTRTSIPGYTGTEIVTRKQLILSDELVQAWTDFRGGEHKRPAFIFGQFYNEITEGKGNTVPGTRIDYQGQQYRETEEDRASFSITLDPIDTELDIISISKPMVLAAAHGAPHPFSSANLFLTCAVQVRDPNTWQPVRYEYLYQVGSGTDKSFCLDVVKNDIQPWYTTAYNPDGTASGTTNNQSEVQTQCQYYATSIAKTLETLISETRTYVGLFPVNMDGAIAQVSYSIDKSGAFTTASLNSEHNFDIPTYEQRRQRDGRHNIDEKMKLLKEINDRKAKLVGTHNT